MKPRDAASRGEPAQAALPSPSLPGSTACLEDIAVALRLSDAGVLVHIDHANPECLQDLVRAVGAVRPDVEVHTDVEDTLRVPAGSTLILLPSGRDATWLNINRPVFARRALRVVLFCDTETTTALLRQAPDFMAWVSHSYECPPAVPAHGVHGLLRAALCRAPFIVWQAGDLEDGCSTALGYPAGIRAEIPRRELPRPASLRAPGRRALPARGGRAPHAVRMGSRSASG